MKKMWFFTSHLLFGSKLAQKLTVIGRFRCSKSTFYRSKLENNKNNKTKTRFYIFSPLAILSFPTRLYNHLTVLKGYIRGKQQQEPKLSCLPPRQRHQKLLRLLDRDSRVVGILQPPLEGAQASKPLPCGSWFSRCCDGVTAIVLGSSL